MNAEASSVEETQPDLAQRFLAYRQVWLCMFAVALAAAWFFPSSALAYDGLQGGVSTVAQQLLDWAKLLWGVVFALLVIAFVVFIIAYISQFFTDVLWRSVSGNWAKNVALLIVAANVLMPILVELAEANMGGWTGP